jgi:uncharacterized protein YecE (DUF72 family)
LFYRRGVGATVRIGICSWADEGLVKTWYPRGVSTAEKRLRHYAERFDTVEADSPFYHLPDPAVAEKWAVRTPEGFTFHAKASKELTGHAETDDAERAVVEYRASLEPLERAGKLRGILLQHHPRVKKSREAMAEIAYVGSQFAPLVPLIEFRHRSWLEEGEREDTLAWLESAGLAYVSVDSPRTRASNVLPPIAAATGPVAYVRFHGRNWKTWNIRGATRSWERFDWEYSPEELGEWVGPVERLAREADEVYAMFNVNRDDQAPRAAAIFRRLLDDAGVPATGGVEPPPAEATLF